MPCPVTGDPELAATIIRRGGVVALPTETVYGLGADASNSQAVARIFAAKERPEFDPLIVHLAELDLWRTVASGMTPLALLLAEQFWPGPLTLVLPKRPSISDLVTAGLPTVGVRVPRHPLMQAVMRSAVVPIAAPSANLFGRLSPTLAEHVQEQLGDRIDLILDGGPCIVGVESTIVQVRDNTAVILRAGGTSIEQLATVAEKVVVSTGSSDRPVAPGMLAAHYAPRTPVVVVDDVPQVPSGQRWGLVSLRRVVGGGFTVCETLAENGSLTEAAAGFFSAMHRLDAAGLDRIVAVRFPDAGLGLALNDRLRRASASRAAASRADG